MRIDLPRCDFKPCFYSSNGICTSKDQYNRCPFRDYKDVAEQQRELDNERDGELSMRTLEYRAPIQVMSTEMTYHQVDDEILKAVWNVGIDVDKEGLLRALNYDRDQYDKGYEDAMKQIVHCCECKRWIPDAGRCSWNGGEKTRGDDFCSRGERKG